MFITAGLILAALGTIAVSGRAGDPGCATGCPATCGPSKVVFRIEEEDEKYTVPVRVQNKAAVKESVRSYYVPRTRLVPVCITDPATGCTRTEHQPVTYYQLVKSTVLEVTPPAEEYTCKTEERTRRHTRVYMSVAPADCVPVK